MLGPYVLSFVHRRSPKGMGWAPNARLSNTGLPNLAIHVGTQPYTSLHQLFFLGIKNLPLESTFAFLDIELCTVNFTLAIALFHTPIVITPITSWLWAVKCIVKLIRVIRFIIVISQCDSSASTTSHTFATPVALVPIWAFSCNKWDEIFEFFVFQIQRPGIRTCAGISQHVLVLDWTIINLLLGVKKLLTNEQVLFPSSSTPYTDLQRFSAFSIFKWQFPIWDLSASGQWKYWRRMFVMSRLDVIPESVICQFCSESAVLIGDMDPRENDLITPWRQLSPSRCSSQPQGSSGSSV